MLSKDALSQLSSLKKEIRATRDVAQGTVRGTSGRFGFVSLADGREAFLSPEQMDRVFHGDNIEVNITQNAKEQSEANIEKLIFSPLKQLAGRYCIKGKGHFVVYEQQHYSRWIFIPPKLRANAKDGDYVTARIIQHPFNKEGKAQAKVTGNIGTDVNLSSARKYALAAYQLFETFSRDAWEQSQGLQKMDVATEKRTDLTHLPFVTIDSVSTRDMDDALAIEPTEQGWRLSVAIADPGSEIDMDSALDTAALRRAHTLYLPGKSITMLPEVLSTERYPLMSGKVKPALVCHLDINTEGNVINSYFEAATIQSKAKLSYQQVSALLNDQAFKKPDNLDDAAAFAAQLQQLQSCSKALHQYRQQHQLVMENRPDYMLVVNSEGKLDAIEKLERTQAHQLVEEAMLATNRAAGEFLASQQAGLFTVHPGYKAERRDDIENLLKEKLAPEDIGDTSTLDGYITLIKGLQSRHPALIVIQQRFLQGSEPSLEVQPHFGLGVKYYATVTSPIRRYQDLYNQRCIHQLLVNKKPTKLRTKQVERLKETLSNNRNVVRTVEQWLISDYLTPYIGQTFTARVAVLTSQGVGVRLDDTGIEGFIVGIKEDKDHPESPYDKISFNNQRMELTWNGKSISLDQTVEVVLTDIDKDKKKPVFQWKDRF